ETACTRHRQPQYAVDRDGSGTRFLRRVTPTCLVHTAPLMAQLPERRRIGIGCTQRPARTPSCFSSSTWRLRPGPVLSSIECPVKRPSTNHANRAAPMANRMSPGTLIQRKVCMEPDCMNSEDRAYQVPCSMEAHACNKPTGSMLRMTMKIKPKLRDQKESFNGVSFHLRPGLNARRQNSVRPRPSIPYTPNRAV